MSGIPETASSGRNILEARGIELNFGRLTALAGADLDVPEGRITGLIGPNGAGKTTLFNLVSGLLRPDAGRVVFDGRDVTGWAPDRLARAGLTRTFQIARGLADLTVLENIMLYALDQPGEHVVPALADSAAARRREAEVLDTAWEMAARLNLTAVANQQAASLSGGQKKLLELGRALLARPKLLLLDEPMAGVNPSLAQSLARQLLDIKDMGITMLVIEHNMSVIAELCDEVTVLAAGKVLARGSFTDIRANQAVQGAYLGSRA